MKKIVLLFFCILSIQIANAQKKQLKKGDYINKFIGTWQWRSGDDSFTITFKKVKQHIKVADIDLDVLRGWFKYVKDGKVIENSIENMGKGSSWTAIAGETEGHWLLVNFTDMNIKKTRTVVMELTSDNNKAIWRINPGYSSGVTHEHNAIPTGDKWIMEKIE